eukprot:122599-Chlamydomonas_euryale.AAC.1
MKQAGESCSANVGSSKRAQLRPPKRGALRGRIECTSKNHTPPAAHIWAMASFLAINVKTGGWKVEGLGPLTLNLLHGRRMQGNGALLCMFPP